MTSRSRVSEAMHLRQPDRVPVMSQLSIGHYFLCSGIPAEEIWFTSEGFAQALVALQRRYGFDGILVNLAGRDPAYERMIERVDHRETETIVGWKNGNYTILPHDDNPHYYLADGSRYFPAFEDLDPERLFYIDPWNLTDITYPFTWDFEESPRPDADFFPPHHLDTVRATRRITGDQVSVHGEVFSPWSQFLELLNHEHALLAMMLDAGKVKACLDRMTDGAIELGKQLHSAGVDAILVSSAFAGSGFISREHYREFVLPFEKRLVTEIQRHKTLPVYTHTCGSIGDRLDLMMETGTNGIDTLDPPPLGTVELAEAKRILNGRTFIKGNIDPVNTLLAGTTQAIQEDVRKRLEIGMPGGGYILSTACSVAPRTPPEHIELLLPLAEQYGRYE